MNLGMPTQTPFVICTEWFRKVIATNQVDTNCFLVNSCSDMYREGHFIVYFTFGAITEDCVDINCSSIASLEIKKKPNRPHVLRN
jgi:hypothetical protein